MKVALALSFVWRTEYQKNRPIENGMSLLLDLPNSTYGGLSKLCETDCVRHSIDSNPMLVDSMFCR